MYTAGYVADLLVVEVAVVVLVSVVLLIPLVAVVVMFDFRKKNIRGSNDWRM